MKRNERSLENSKSKSRKNSLNVRELIHSQEEVKMFEHKFQGSLQKLDDFEKQWNTFKTTNSIPDLN